MPISNDSLNKKLYDLLKTQGFNPVPKNSKGDTTPVPNDADVFRFTFKVDDKPVGPAWVTVDSNQDLKVYYDDEVMDGLNEETGTNHIDDFTEFLQQLKRWAQRRQLGFELENQDHLESDMAQREHVKKQEQISEGYYPMGKTSSYNDSVPSIKIVLQHTRAIQEGEQRFRNIARIFLENTMGERILAPTTRPGIARVYARHLAEGGLPHDERWGHIGNLVEEYTKMAGFVRATRGNQFNESAQQLVNEGINHYNSLRETLSKMTGHRGYNSYFESWTPALMEDETDNDTLNELFVQETMDPRIESVMPILSRLQKKVNEMSEVNELAEWADNIISEKMVMGSGSDASSAGSYKMGETTDLKSIPQENIDENRDYERGEEYEDMADRELMRHANMLGLEKNLVPDDEGGLANRREIIRLLQQQLHDEDLEESGLQAYLGNKKYGKEGMDALRKAGRDHASKEKMASIRAKYDKLDEIEMEEGLGDIAKKVGGALKKVGSKALDTLGHPDDAEMLKDLQRKMGAPKHAQHGKPSMAKPNESVEEDLDANQKRVGQLGPTEKVKNNNIGKLVGANESFINTVAQAVTTEELDMTESKSFGPENPYEVKPGEDFSLVFKPGKRSGVHYHMNSGMVADPFYFKLNDKLYSVTNQGDGIPQEVQQGIAEGGFFDPDQPDIGDMVKHINGATGKVKKIGTQGDETHVYFKDKNGEMNFGMWKKHVFPIKKPGVAEGSVSKEKQKTPYRDINSPEYRSAANKQKQQMAKDKAAEPGKKLADKIAKKGVAEGTDGLAKQYGWTYNQGQYGASMTHPKHGRISLSSPITSGSGDTAVEREWTHNNASGIGDRSLAQHLQSLKEQGVAEGTYSKDVERAFPDGKASGVKTGSSAPKGTSTMPKDKDKAKGMPANSITEMDTPGPYDDPYAKGGKATPMTADKAKKDFAKMFQKNIDKANKAKQDTDKKVAQHQVKEGQEDLDAILRIIRK